MMNNDPPRPVDPSSLRVAVAGCGRMGLRHIQALQALGMQICGVADRSADALQAGSRLAGIRPEHAFDDAQEMLSRLRPDAVVVATTAPAHEPLVLAASATGVRYVLCEKPMATSLEAADRMITACRASGTVLAVNHQMRFMPQYTQAKALLGSDELGPLSSILVAGSNFGLAMNLSHYFEMQRFMTGTAVQSVQAWLEPQPLASPRGSEFDDRSGRLLSWSASGVPMYADFSAASGHGLQCTYICRLGQITVDELRGEMRVMARSAEHRALPTTRYGMPADYSMHAIEPVDVVVPTMQVWRAMLDGRDWPDGDAGRQAQACLVAAHHSQAEGSRAVRLDEPTLPLAQRFAWA